MIKFFFDAMYYQFFIYNRDKFKLEDPHERTVLLFCGILFLPIIALIYPLIKENFNYDLPFIFFVPIFCILYYLLNRYYVRKGKGIEIIREKPLLFKKPTFIVHYLLDGLPIFSCIALFHDNTSALAENNIIKI